MVPVLLAEPGDLLALLPRCMAPLVVAPLQNRRAPCRGALFVCPAGIVDGVRVSAVGGDGNCTGGGPVSGGSGDGAAGEES